MFLRFAPTSAPGPSPPEQAQADQRVIQLLRWAPLLPLALLPSALCLPTGARTRPAHCSPLPLLPQSPFPLISTVAASRMAPTSSVTCPSTNTGTRSCPCPTPLRRRSTCSSRSSSSLQGLCVEGAHLFGPQVVLHQGVGPEGGQRPVRPHPLLMHRLHGPGQDAQPRGPAQVDAKGRVLGGQGRGSVGIVYTPGRVGVGVGTGVGVGVGAGPGRA